MFYNPKMFQDFKYNYLILKIGFDYHKLKVNMGCFLTHKLTFSHI